MLELCKYGSKVCETKWLTDRGSGLFKYLGSQVDADGECERDVVHRMI